MNSKLAKIVLIPVLFIICFILTGCPYSSSVALDSEPQHKINERILGTWKSTILYDSSWVRFEKKSEMEYSITAYIYDINNNSYYTKHFTGFISMIANHRVLNVKDESTYYYVVVSITSDGLNLQPLDNDIKDKFNTSEEATGFFTKELSRPEERIRYDLLSQQKGLKKAD